MAVSAYQAQQYLEQYQSALADLEYVKEREAALRAEAEGSGVADLSGEPHTTVTGGREVKLSALADLSSYLARKRDRAAAICLDIELRIDTALEYREQRVVRERYIQGKTWQEVAKSLDYTESHVMTMHRRALRKIASTLDR